MKVLTILAGAVALGALATPALATDFTGPRVEAHAGWDRVGIDSRALGVDDHEDGIAYGAGLGYDFALTDTVIAGVEANIDFFDTDYGATVGTTAVGLEAKRDFDISARLGKKLTDNALFYVKAGYTNARLKALATSGGITASNAENGDGVRVGAGLEYALTDNFYAKTEYRYSNYEGGFSRNQILAGVGFRF